MLRIFTSVHVPGHLNGVADMLSRGGPQVREWRLHPRIVAQIWDRFGRAEVDLFCVCRELTLPAVFLDHRQERSAGCGRSVAFMAQDPAVCVSAGGSDTAHSRSGASGGSITDSGGALLASKDVVRGHQGVTVGDAVVSSPEKRPAVTGRGQILHPQPGLWSLWAYPLRERN